MAAASLELLRAARLRGRPLVIAHRGGRGLFPENSLAAFAGCWRAGADGVELDVRLCASGEVVVFHDERLEERTDGEGLVAGRDFSHLRGLRVRDREGRPSEEKIPRLEEALEALPAGRYLNVEIKHDRGDPRLLVGAVAGVLRSEPAAGRRPVVLSSFHPLALLACRVLASELPRGLLLGSARRERLPQWLSRHLTAPGALHPERTLIDEALMSRARRRGWEVAAWTVNEPAEMERLCRLGVAALITDRPDRAQGVLDALPRGARRT